MLDVDTQLVHDAVHAVLSAGPDTLEVLEKMFVDAWEDCSGHGTQVCISLLTLLQSGAGDGRQSREAVVSGGYQLLS